MALAGLEPGQGLADPFIQGVGEAIQRRGNHEGQGHADGQWYQPFGQRDTGHDQPEFAVVGEGQAAEEGAARAQPECQQQEEEQGALERQHQGRHQGKEHGLVVGQAFDANLQEEADQKDLLHAPQRLGQLLGAGMVGQHGAEHQGPEFRAQANGLETVTAQHQGQQQAQQHQQFVVATGIQQPEQQGPQQRQAEHHQCPLRGRLARWPGS